MVEPNTNGEYAMDVGSRLRGIFKTHSDAFAVKCFAKSLVLSTFCGISTVQAIDPWTYFSGKQRIRPTCNVPPGDYQYLPRTPAVSSGSLPALPRHSPETMERAIQAARNPIIQKPTIDPVVASPSILVPNASLVPMMATSPWTAGPWAAQLPSEQGGVPKALQQSELQGTPARASLLQPTSVRPDAKTLQMSAPFLDVAHCRIRDASIAIDPKGNWTISFKAEQNPLLDRKSIVRNTELQLKRNLFVLDIRLTDAAVSRVSAVSAAMQPLPTIENHRSTGLVQLQVPRISIQRESSEIYTFQGFEPKIAQYFEYIAGAEFQFYALLDPLAGSGQGVVMPWQHPSWKK